MALLPTNDYVKFVRGSKTAFKNLAQKQDDTLYFIYDTADKTSGLLYIGERLIGGSEGALSSLSDLKDIIVSEVKDKQLLIYDEGSQAWKNGSIIDLISADGVSIEKTEIGTLTLKNFTQAEIGSLPAKSDSGDLTWYTPAQILTVLDTYSKEEIDNKINEKLNSSLTRKIVESTADIDVEAADAEQYIYLVLNDKNTYDEYLVVNKQLEKVGDWEVNLDDYVTKAEVGTLVTNEFNTITIASIGDLTNYGGDNLTLVEKVEEIDGRLKWSEITTE